MQTTPYIQQISEEVTRRKLDQILWLTGRNRFRDSQYIVECLWV